MILPDLNDLAKFNTPNVFPGHESRRFDIAYSRSFSDIDSSDSDSTASTAQCSSSRSDSICCHSSPDTTDPDCHLASYDIFFSPNYAPDCDAIILPDFSDLSNVRVCNTPITRRASKPLEWPSASVSKGWPGKSECGWHSTLNLGVQILSAVLIVDCGLTRDADTK
jgi:hypothetical protein